MQASPDRRRVWLVLVLVVAVALVQLRPRVRAVSRAPEGDVVEVSGDVPRPGVYVLPPPITEREALVAAGATWPAVEPGAVLPSGTRLDVRGDEVRVGQMARPYVFGIRLDVNQASASDLAALPGIGRAKADAIVALRQRRGAFATLDELDLVEGIGPGTVAALRPWATAVR